MADVVDAQKRSQMMSGIRGQNTRPEILLRKALHRRGFRFRLHVATLPGKPDIVFPKWRAIIQVQGCFWHCHKCHLFKWPSTRVDFWRIKITSNRQRDVETNRALAVAGWRILTVWECATKGRTRLPEGELTDLAAAWLLSGTGNKTLQGRLNNGSC
jgi:DNA mismatch endonuclease (patch repair protein)